MFDKFGFMTADQINELADNLLNEGDTESIIALAQENGIDTDLVDMFISGEIQGICDAMTAALGKIEMEAKELKPQDIMEDWVEYLKSLVADSEEVAKQVRTEGKTLKGMIAALLSWSFKHQNPVPADIAKAAGVNGRVTLGLPNMATVKKIIREYYGGEA